MMNRFLIVAALLSHCMDTGNVQIDVIRCVQIGGGNECGKMVVYLFLFKKHVVILILCAVKPLG